MNLDEFGSWKWGIPQHFGFWWGKLDKPSNWVWNLIFTENWGIPFFFQNRAPPACTNLQYFAIVFLKLSRKTIIYLLHVCWPMPICCKRKRKRGEKQNKIKTKNQKTKKNKKILMKVTKIGFLGVRNFVFFVFVFCFFKFLVFWFLVFWFVIGFLKGWQNNTKVKDLDLTLCQFSHFRGCKLAFGWFYWLLWACGSIRKPCKKNHGKMQVSLEEAWGAWDTD